METMNHELKTATRLMNHIKSRPDLREKLIELDMEKGASPVDVMLEFKDTWPEIYLSLLNM